MEFSLVPFQFHARFTQVCQRIPKSCVNNSCCLPTHLNLTELQSLRTKDMGITRLINTHQSSFLFFHIVQRHFWFPTSANQLNINDASSSVISGFWFFFSHKLLSLYKNIVNIRVPLSKTCRILESFFCLSSLSFLIYFGILGTNK